MRPDRFLLALALALATMLPPSSVRAKAAHAMSAGKASSWVADLPRFLARSRPSWPADSAEEDSVGTVLGTRRDWSVSFPGKGIASIPSDSAFAGRLDFSEDCRTWPYRHFFVGKDTITFNYARIP